MSNIAQHVEKKNAIVQTAEATAPEPEAWINQDLKTDVKPLKYVKT